MSIWNKLAKSKRYRAQFVSATARRAFAFQLRAIMKKRGISQEKLAEFSGLTQGVISRAADPNYGKLTVTIKAKIAAGLDMAYLGTLVPFSDATKWLSDLSEESVQIQTFMEENHPELGSSVEAAKRKSSYGEGHLASIGAQYGDAEKKGQYLENKSDEAA